MDIPNEGWAAGGTGGFDANAVPGALVGTTTESIAATRKLRPGIGSDVHGTRRGVQVSRSAVVWTRHGKGNGTGSGRFPRYSVNPGNPSTGYSGQFLR